MLVVTDASLVAAGIVQSVLDSLVSAGLGVTLYDAVTMEPTCAHVEDGLETLRADECSLVLGVGSGSAIDAAKAIAIMATNSTRIQDCDHPGVLRRPALPVIAVPTPAGTGSEVTHFAVITDTVRSVKLVIISSFVIPQVALVDPLLTMTMPRSVRASTGLDALTHAIEAYVSAKAQPMSDLMALSAVELLGKYLSQAWEYPTDHEARTWTMLGVLQAGVATSNSSTALVHGMTRALGAYFHIPHGVANAALLADVMEFSLLRNPGRYARIAEALGVDVDGRTAMDAALEGAALVRKMVRGMGVPTLRGLGVTEGELNKVVVQMTKETVASGNQALNPRVPTEEEIIVLYQAAM